MRTSQLSCVCIVLATIPLQGCVTSQLPLLDEKSSIVDKSLTGHYVLTFRDNGNTESDQKPSAYDVYLKGNKYLFVQNGTLTFIGTLHANGTGGHLVQLREVTRPGKVGFLGASYSYIIVKNATASVEINSMRCEGVNYPCTVKDLAALLAAAIFSENNPDERQLATATKITELGQ